MRRRRLKSGLAQAKAEGAEIVIIVVEKARRTARRRRDAFSEAMWRFGAMPPFTARRVSTIGIVRNGTKPATRIGDARAHRGGWVAVALAMEVAE
jgi:hypothetical protein